MDGYGKYVDEDSYLGNYQLSGSFTVAGTGAVSITVIKVEGNN